MLMIRLRRGGAKKKPIYRVVVSDSRKTPQGDYLDQVGYYDPNQDPVMKLGLTGDIDLARIRFVAEKEVKQALESIEGVAACSISGGLEDEIHIDIDEQKLSLLNIPITTVASRLAQENVDLSAGILKQKDTQFLVRTVNQFRDVEEINRLLRQYGQMRKLMKRLGKADPKALKRQLGIR